VTQDDERPPDAPPRTKLRDSIIPLLRNFFAAASSSIKAAEGGGRAAIPTGFAPRLGETEKRGDGTLISSREMKRFARRSVSH
jgi:hypothetical protein